MICPSCGYSNNYKKIEIQEPVYYKKGNKKGQFKRYETKTKILNKEDEPFYPLRIVHESFKEEFEIQYRKAKNDIELDEIENDRWLNWSDPELRICPNCGTIVSKEVNEEKWVNYE